MALHPSRKMSRDYFDDAEPFKIEGVYCKLIPLTQGHVAIVDLEDYGLISRRSWHVLFQEKNRSFYACSNASKKLGTHHLIWMHREILGLDFKDPIQGDHVDPRQTLMNTRSNLRRASHIQNQYNKRKLARNTSGFKGVSWKADHNSYEVRITANRKTIRLGYRKNIDEAAALYAEGAKKYHVEFSRID